MIIRPCTHERNVGVKVIALRGLPAHWVAVHAARAFNYSGSFGEERHGTLALVLDCRESRGRLEPAGVDLRVGPSRACPAHPGSREKEQTEQLAHVHPVALRI